MKTVFLRMLNEEAKDESLRTFVCNIGDNTDSRRVEVDVSEFSSIPRSPFAYWVSGHVRRLFRDLPLLESRGRTAKQGLATADDFRFVRAWWEVPPGSKCQKWFPFAKGGSFSRFYTDVHLVVNWGQSGAEISNFFKAGSDRIASRPQNIDFFFRPGLTWSDRTTSLFSARTWPPGGVFSVKGSAGFFDGEELFALGLLNSLAFNLFLSLLVGAGDAAARSYQVGVIAGVPWPIHDPAVADLARRAWSLKFNLDTSTETSHAFIRPVLLRQSSGSLSTRASEWANAVAHSEADLTSIQRELDDRCFNLYGIGDVDREATVRGLGGQSTTLVETPACIGDDEDGEDSEGTGNDASILASELISWATGAAFGRFDVRLATGEKALPPEPDPFDPVPACSPAMLTGTGGVLLSEPPPGYPLSFPFDGVLLDDPGHPRDLTASVRGVFQVVFGAHTDAWWQEAAALLDPKDRDLRTWMAKSFFEHHLKRYSKSRRKAPILWQLATPSASYSVWLYAHRLTKDSFFTVLNDHVTPKVQHEERRLDGLIQAAGGSPTACQRKEIAAQETFVQELRAFREEVARVAPLWNPDLDDGVIITMAPLWRLVPQHRAWQKELRGCWDRLAAGDYDWAHLAMHLWPERVVAKCQADRSLAIAHGLEDAFWLEGSDGKWKPRKVDPSTVANLVQERTRPAVKAALESLTEASATSPGGTAHKRTRSGG